MTVFVHNIVLRMRLVVFFLAQQLVGIRISVLQLRGQWVTGLVTSYDASSSQHSLIDDADKQIKCVLKS